MTDDALLEQLRPALEKGFPFLTNMGLQLDAIDRGYCRMTAPLEPNVNHIGTMYAGALFTLAEVPGGAIFLATFDATRYYPIVRGMDIQFLKMARTDVSVEVHISDEEVDRIQDEATEHGKANYSWECTLTDTEGVVVARTTNTYQLRRHGT